MKYVVIRSGGKQYRVSEGDILEVDRLPVAADGEVSFDSVLLSVSDESVKIGSPTIPNAHVSAKVLGQTKGEKIRVSKFKSKVRHRRVSGFRSSLTKVQIVNIGVSKKEEAKKPLSKTTKQKTL